VPDLRLAGMDSTPPQKLAIHWPKMPAVKHLAHAGRQSSRKSSLAPTPRQRTHQARRSFLTEF
jgi:hypothetical protein